MNAHDRARDLIAAGVQTDDQRLWLDQHLGDCALCARLARTADAVSFSLRSSPTLASSSLVHATHLLVRARAAQLNEMQARMRMMWIGVAIGILVGIVTTPLLWIFAEWVGRTYSLSTIAWQTGFFVMWFIPASFAAAAALAIRPAALQDSSRKVSYER